MTPHFRKQKNLASLVERWQNLKTLVLTWTRYVQNIKVCLNLKNRYPKGTCALAVKVEFESKRYVTE